MIYESPEKQRLKVELEAILETEVKKLCEIAWERKFITLWGQTPPEYEKPWQIQIDGKHEYFTLEQAKLRLEKMLETKES